MDKDLLLLIQGAEQQDGKNKGATLAITDESKGDVAVEYPDGRRTYTLKPLGELYGPDKGTTSIVPTDKHYQPLLMAIETEIVSYHETNPQLADGDVLLALNRLTMNPAADCGNDLLCRQIQLGLRLCLSINEYSRQETKLAIRKVVQSVERHTRLAGPRGYISFIRQFVP